MTNKILAIETKKSPIACRFQWSNSLNEGTPGVCITFQGDHYSSFPHFHGRSPKIRATSERVTADKMMLEIP